MNLVLSIAYEPASLDVKEKPAGGFSLELILKTCSDNSVWSFDTVTNTY